MTNFDSEVVIHKGGGVTFAGKDAVHLFRAISIKSALNLYAKTGMKANTAYTPTAMMRVATEYTGKTYKRGQCALAAADMQVWIDTMKAAMPVTDNTGDS